MKEVRKIIERLIGEYTIESMNGEVVCIANMPETDEDQNVALMQRQSGTWCLQSKKFLISDTVTPLSKQGMVASYIKGKMSNYIKDTKNRDITAMHYLFASDNIDVLCQQISMLARHAIYKDVEEINNVPDETRKNSLNPENVSLYICIYTMFTLIANDNMNAPIQSSQILNTFLIIHEHKITKQINIIIPSNYFIMTLNNLFVHIFNALKAARLVDKISIMKQMIIRTEENFHKYLL